MAGSRHTLVARVLIVLVFGGIIGCSTLLEDGALEEHDEVLFDDSGGDSVANSGDGQGGGTSGGSPSDGGSGSQGGSGNSGEGDGEASGEENNGGGSSNDGGGGNSGGGEGSGGDDGASGEGGGEGGGGSGGGSSGSGGSGGGGASGEGIEAPLADPLALPPLQTMSAFVVSTDVLGDPLDDLLALPLFAASGLVRPDAIASARFQQRGLHPSHPWRSIQNHTRVAAEEIKRTLDLMQAPIPVLVGEDAPFTGSTTWASASEAGRYIARTILDNQGAWVGIMGLGAATDIAQGLQLVVADGGRLDWVILWLDLFKMDQNQWSDFHFNVQADLRAAAYVSTVKDHNGRSPVRYYVEGNVLSQAGWVRKNEMTQAIGNRQTSGQRTLHHILNFWNNLPAVYSQTNPWYLGNVSQVMFLNDPQLADQKVVRLPRFGSDGSIADGRPQGDLVYLLTRITREPIERDWLRVIARTP